MFTPALYPGLWGQPTAVKVPVTNDQLYRFTGCIQMHYIRFHMQSCSLGDVDIVKYTSQTLDPTSAQTENLNLNRRAEEERAAVASKRFLQSLRREAAAAGFISPSPSKALGLPDPTSRTAGSLKAGAVSEGPLSSGSGAFVPAAPAGEGIGRGTAGMHTSMEGMDMAGAMKAAAGAPGAQANGKQLAVDIEVCNSTPVAALLTAAA